MNLISLIQSSVQVRIMHILSWFYYYVFRTLGDVCWKRNATRSQSSSSILLEAGPKMMMYHFLFACSSIKPFWRREFLTHRTLFLQFFHHPCSMLDLLRWALWTLCILSILHTHFHLSSSLSCSHLSIILSSV